VNYRGRRDQARSARVEALAPGRVRVTAGDLDVELTCADLGHGLFRLTADDGRTWRVRADRDGSVRHVTVEGVGQARLEAEGKGRRRRREAPEGALSSLMPGTVVKVLVAEGDTVAKGDDLVVVEAMKMEIKLSAPRDGVVRSVAAREGQGCDAGQTLVELAEPGAE